MRVVKADGTYEQREVEVGVTNRVSAEIVSGLEPGEVIVTGQRVPATAPRAKSDNSARPPITPRI